MVKSINTKYGKKMIMTTLSSGTYWVPAFDRSESGIVMNQESHSQAQQQIMFNQFECKKY